MSTAATRSSQDRAASNLCPPHLQHRKSAAMSCSKPGQKVRHLSLAPCLPAKATLSVGPAAAVCLALPAESALTSMCWAVATDARRSAYKLQETQTQSRCM